MSMWSRIANVLRGDRLNREIDEELQSHIDAAIEQGRDPSEARQTLGSTLRLREESRDVRLFAWLDSLRADVVFGWRQLCKKKVTSAAAILSLGLAIGACTSAFRLIDALLLRPLPVAAPEQLYALARAGMSPIGNFQVFDEWAYPAFVRMRAAAKNQAELIAISRTERTDLSYGVDGAIEKANTQYVSGSMFDSFGLRPALGRLFTERDDVHPGAHPYAVLSHDYWTSRFAEDPKVIGQTFRIGNDVFEIIGVAGAPFTGTEPGTIVDIFLPTMMNSFVTRSDATWHRTLARINPGVALEPLRQKLEATSRAFEEERAKGFRGWPKERLRNFLDQKLRFKRAAAGVSDLQNDNRSALFALAVLVALVLLIACANVANLMTAQAAARSREMALRVSIGAGRWRLLQLVLVESAMLAMLASIVGALFSAWSAPFVVSMINPPDNPARLLLPADWRVLLFGVGITILVTLLFGVAPALRASGTRPASALKGGEDPHSRRRIMHALIASQVAFCFVVLFVAGLFVTTFDRLANQPTGFSAERVLTLDTVAQQPQPVVFWNQLADSLRTTPGVEVGAISGWPLMAGSWNSFISVNGAPPSDVLTYFLRISPGWLDAMKIPLIDGRDIHPSDAHPGVAIVNEAFAKQYFNGENPVGKSFATTYDRFGIVGLVRDFRYRSIREPVLPVAFVPFPALDASGVLKSEDRGTFILRTAASNPVTIVPALRHVVAKAGHGFRVANVRTQTEIVQSQTVRERLVAMLALFFALIALLLAGIGLYGVLEYSVLQRRREIGIRLAIGAPSADIARKVITDVFAMVLVGAAGGIALGFVSSRYIESLLYQVKSTDPGALALPSLAIVASALLAAVAPVIHAVRIDPVTALRTE